METGQMLGKVDMRRYISQRPKLSDARREEIRVLLDELKDKSLNYFIGRTLQLIGLLILPSAIWVAEVQKSESGALSIFFGGMAIFFLGWSLTKRVH